MVTDPAVIGSIVSRLERRTDADIAVAGASDERISVARTAEYLGYASLLERFGAEFVDLADESRTEDICTVGGSPVALSVPGAARREYRDRRPVAATNRVGRSPARCGARRARRFDGGS